ncbi:UNVERIFIED_CONTAM: hypothetical protein FKN15_036590 [Acipenser sinensis]
MQLKRDAVCFVKQLKRDAVCFVVQLKRDAVCFVMQAFPEHGVQPAYHQVFTQSLVCMPQPPVLQQEPVKDQRLYAMHRGFSQSPMGLKPRYTRSSHYHSRKDYRPEESILAPPASTESLN